MILAALGALVLCSGSGAATDHATGPTVVCLRAHGYTVTRTAPPSWLVPKPITDVLVGKQDPKAPPFVRDAQLQQVELLSYPTAAAAQAAERGWVEQSVRATCALLRKNRDVCIKHGLPTAAPRQTTDRNVFIRYLFADSAERKLFNRTYNVCTHG
jgi:hypothetical protein